MSDDNLNELDEKLAHIREAEQAAARARNAKDADNMNNGARAGMELVTSILAGGGIGWALDGWLHTRPWLMIVFLFAGIFAGFMSVYRITNSLAVHKGSAALQTGQKTATKPPEFNDDDD